MGDLVCGPQSHYSHEPLMSEMPPLVCEEPPEETRVSTPPVSSESDDFQTQSTNGKSSPALTFLDHENQVCEAPPEPLMSADDRTHIPESRFQSTLKNSHVVAEMHLQAKDINGAQNRSPADIQGTIKEGKISVNKDLFAPALYSLKGSETSSGNTTTKIKDVSFSASNQTYTLNMEVTKDALGFIPFWDNFEVQFKAKNGKLLIQIDDNWFPNSKILEQLESKIKDSIRSKLPEKYSNIQFKMSKDDDTIELKPQIKNLKVPLGEQGDLTLESINSDKARVSIDRSGHLHVDLKNVDFEGSTGLSGPKAQPQKSQDTLDLKVKVGLGKDQNREVHAEGSLSIDLDEKETQALKIGNETLGNYLKSGTLKNTFSLHLTQAKDKAPVVENKNYLDIENADLGNGKKVNLKSTLKLKYEPGKGFHLDTVDYDYSDLKLDTTTNGIDLMVNGENYFPEMKKLIGQAKESIALETFMFTEDKMGKEVAYLLARKAAGLTAKGPIQADPESQKGVDVRFIFNSWKGNAADGKASTEMLVSAREQVIKEIKSSAMPKSTQDRMIQQVENKLKWAFFSEGILRSDHRKVLVVDGGQATVGGMNIGERYMSDHGYHDVMLKVAGPEVQKIHKEFLENWFEFNQQPQPSPEQWQNMLKSKADLQTELESLQATGKYKGEAKIQTLVTDDQQVDIERGIVKLIDEAHTEINIQQAFFHDETINRHLAEAIKRGVKINVIVAETPLAESVFTSANLLSVYELAKLKKTGALGDIKLFYYGAGKEGKRSQIHTKAISADGKRAIIGSANMIGRSLSSPFMQESDDGTLKQAMYNKELSLFIEGEDFVAEINQQLFHEDMAHHTRELDAEAIEAEVKKAGGEEALRIKSLAAPFT